MWTVWTTSLSTTTSYLIAIKWASGFLLTLGQFKVDNKILLKFIFLRTNPSYCLPSFAPKHPICLKHIDFGHEFLVVVFLAVFWLVFWAVWGLTSRFTSGYEVHIIFKLQLVNSTSKWKMDLRKNLYLLVWHQLRP